MTYTALGIHFVTVDVFQKMLLILRLSFLQYYLLQCHVQTQCRAAA